MANDLSKVIALADLGEAVLAAVKESGLARIKHRRASSTNGRRGKRQAKGDSASTPLTRKAKASASKKSRARKSIM